MGAGARVSLFQRYNCEQYIHKQYQRESNTNRILRISFRTNTYINKEKKIRYKSCKVRHSRGLLAVFLQNLVLTGITHV